MDREPAASDLLAPCDRLRPLQPGRDRAGSFSRCADPVHDIYRLPSSPKARSSIYADHFLAHLAVLTATGSAYSSFIAYRFGNPPELVAWPLDTVPPAFYFLAAAFFLFLALLALRRRSLTLLTAAVLTSAYLALVPFGVSLQSPLSLFNWSSLYSYHEHYQEISQEADRFVLLGSFAPHAVLVAIAISRLARLDHHADSHGSARWATPQEIAATGLLDGLSGIVLCQLLRPDDPSDLRLLVDSAGRHVLTLAPTGAGKTSTIVIPTLLTWRGSLIVLDIKGELHKQTSGFRSAFLGNKVLAFNPTSEDFEAHCSWNALDCVPRGHRDVDYARLIAQTLAQQQTGSQESSTWTDEARSLISAAILHVLYAESDKSLSGVAELLSQDDHKALLKRMARTCHDDDQPHPYVQKIATRLAALADRTLTGVFFAANAVLADYLEPLFARYCRHSDFHPRDFQHHENPVSLYIALPASRIEKHAYHIRLLLQLTLSILTETPTNQRRSSDPATAPAPSLLFPSRLLKMNRSAPAPKPRAWPLLLALDELSSLKKAGFLESYLPYLRGYGIRVLAIFQTAAQIKAMFDGRHEAFSPHFETRVVMTPNDEDSAEMVSKFLGQLTVVRESTSRSTPTSLIGGGHPSATTQTAMHARSLLAIDEVRSMPEDRVIVFRRACRPILAKLSPYFDDPRFHKGCDLSPVAFTDRLPTPSPWPVRTVPVLPDERDLKRRIATSPLATSLLGSLTEDLSDDL